MMEFIKADLHRYFKIGGGSSNPPISKKIRIVLENYGFHAILVYRLGHWIELKSNTGKLHFIKYLLYGIYAILNRLVIKMYDIRIERNATIGKGLYIGHFGGIGIDRCTMGENCSFHQRVRIEGDVSISYGRQCHIGNNVWIGPHAVIKKGINIGDDVTIAAGSVVSSDVERKCLAIGNPARILKRNYNNSGLLGELTIEKKTLSP